MSDDEHPEAEKRPASESEPDQVLAAARSAGSHASSSAWMVTREVAALDHLTHHLGRDRYLPPLGGWSIDYSTLAHLLDLLVRRDGPVRLLELGSGAGTPWTASIVAHVGGEMITVEHDEDFAASTGALLEHYDLAGTCRVVHAPLVPLGPGHEGQEGTAPLWYSAPAILEALGDAPVDVLVVDGPPGATGPLARHPALPVLAGHLADGAIIVLDDTVREEEQEIFRRWQETLGGQLRPLPVIAQRSRAATFTHGTEPEGQGQSAGSRTS